MFFDSGCNFAILIAQKDEIVPISLENLKQKRAEKKQNNSVKHHFLFSQKTNCSWKDSKIYLCLN